MDLWFIYDRFIINHLNISSKIQTPVCVLSYDSLTDIHRRHQDRRRTPVKCVFFAFSLIEYRFNKSETVFN